VIYPKAYAGRSALGDQVNDILLWIV